jgi:hypothetical protein
MVAAIPMFLMLLVLVLMTAPPAGASRKISGGGAPVYDLNSFAPAPNGGFWIQFDDRTGPLTGTYPMDGAPKFPSVPVHGTIAAIPGQAGYWIVSGTGDIFARGTAPELCAGKLSNCSGFTGSPRVITGATANPDGQGLWAVDDHGHVWTAGSAQPYGDVACSTGCLLYPSAIVATPSGAGYYIVESDGGVFAFGDAVFFGSTGGQRPGGGGHDVTGMALSMNRGGTVDGYWLVADCGIVLDYGHAAHLGDTGGCPAQVPINVISIAAVPNGRSYAWLFANRRMALSRTVPTVTITSAYNGLVIAAPFATGGSPLLMESPTGDLSQQWDLWPADNFGTAVQLVNVSGNGDLCADLPNNEINATLEEFGCHGQRPGGVNQLWKLVPAILGRTRFEAVGHPDYFLGMVTPPMVGGQLKIQGRNVQEVFSQWNPQ